MQSNEIGQMEEIDKNKQIIFNSENEFSKS